MRLLLTLFLIGGLAAPAAVPASAQATGDRRAQAMQCLLAMSAANGVASNNAAREAAKIGMLYFAAKLSGIDPNIDLTAAARTQLPGLTRQRLQALIPQCGSEMQARERQIAAMGQKLKPAK